MLNGLVAFPLQIACHIILPANMSYWTTPTDVRIPEPTTLPEGYTAFPDIGMAYRYYAYSRTWNSARKDCVAHGANLAVVDSFKKIDHVMKTKQSDIGVWVGIHKLFDDVEWVSVKSALPLATIPWAPTETGVSEPSEKCASLWQDGRGLATVQCNRTHHFVCEIELQLLPSRI